MLKSSLNGKKTLVLLAVISVISGIGLCFVAEFCLPVVAAVLAVLYLYDSSRTKMLSILTSAFILAVNVCALVFVGGYSAVLALESVLLAAIITVCYLRRATKASTVLYTTLLASVFIVVAFASIPMIAERTFSLEAVKDFYTVLYDTIKQSFITILNEVYASVDMGGTQISISAEELEAVFERAAYMLISIVIICGFIVAGITLKIFSAFVSRLDDEPLKVKEWRLDIPVLYAYFFMGLSLINIFTASSMSVLALSVSNLYNIFMCVYAYVGVKMLYNRFSANHSKFAVRLIIFAVILLAFSFALQIFALVGVFYSVYQSKLQKHNGG